MKQGTYVQPGEKGIVIGQKLAEELNARLGDKLVITVQQAGGDLASGAQPIRGIYRTGSDLFDSEYAFIGIDAARRLGGLQGDQASRIALRLSDRAGSAARVKKERRVAPSSHLEDRCEIRVIEISFTDTSAEHGA